MFKLCLIQYAEFESEWQGQWITGTMFIKLTTRWCNEHSSVEHVIEIGIERYCLPENIEVESDDIKQHRVSGIICLLDKTC